MSRHATCRYCDTSMGFVERRQASNDHHYSVFYCAECEEERIRG